MKIPARPFFVVALAMGCFLPGISLSAPAAKAGSPAADDPPRPIPPVKSAPLREVRSIALPGGSMHLRQGIIGGFLGGKYRNPGENKSLYQWQGEAAYFYKPWLSGGASFKIIAGEPSDVEQKVQNRYFINLRFHKAWPTLGLYAGPQLGLENLNILTGAPGVDTLAEAIKEPFRNTNASLGLEMGGGWKFSRWVGLTMGSLAEYSLVGRPGTTFGDNLNIRLSPGIAVDLLAFTDNLRKVVPALYLHVEGQVGFLLFERAERNTDQAILMGIGLAF